MGVRFWGFGLVPQFVWGGPGYPKRDPSFQGRVTQIRAWRFMGSYKCGISKATKRITLIRGLIIPHL